jgi:hypothetical protein
MLQRPDVPQCRDGYRAPVRYDGRQSVASSSLTKIGESRFRGTTSVQRPEVAGDQFQADGLDREWS